MDRVCPLKIEDSGSGTETDTFPTSLDPNEDYVEMRGVVFQNDSSSNETVYINRDSSDNMVFADGVYSGEVSLSNLYDGHWSDEGSYIKPKQVDQSVRLYFTGGAYTEFSGTGITGYSGFTLQASGDHKHKRAVASSGFAEFANTSASHYHGLKTFYGTDSASTYVSIWHDGTDGQISASSGKLTIGSGNSSGDDIELEAGGHLFIQTADGDSEFMNKTGGDAWLLMTGNGSYKHGIKIFYGSSSSTHRLNVFHSGSDGYLSTVPSSGDGIIMNPDSDIVRVINGVEFYGYAGDLSSPPDGTIWYDSTNNRFRCRIDGRTYTMAMR